MQHHSCCVVEKDTCAVVGQLESETVLVGKVHPSGHKQHAGLGQILSQCRVWRLKFNQGQSIETESTGCSGCQSIDFVCDDEEEDV